MHHRVGPRCLGQRATRRRGGTAAILLALLPTAAIAQEAPGSAAQDSVRARRGAEFVIPVVSVVLPGFGQYVHGAPAAGAAYTATFLGGGTIAHRHGWGEDAEGDLPRRPRDQIGEQAAAVMQSAMFLSGWDAFQRSVPALQRQGKYDFLTRRESVGDLLSAPFDPRFLRRWTTWVDLAQTAAITALILSDRKSSSEHVPFHAHDAAFAVGLSMNAAVGEEALFRGWLLPLLHQQTGRRFWVANGVQAGVFGAAHLPDAEWFAGVIAGWALWEGWIVRRNDWSIRESIFHHFWYDVFVISASFLVDERQPRVSITFPAISF